MLHSLPKEVRTGTQAKREPGGSADVEAMEGCTDYWFAPHGLLSLLIELRTTNPGIDASTMDWVLLHHQ